jgi:MFS family permease
MPVYYPSSPSSDFAARTPFFYGWVIVPIASLALFVSGPGQTFTVALFVDHIMEDLALTRGQISSLYTAGSLSAAAIMVIVGRLLDRWGARTMLTAAGVFLGLAGVWMSQVDQPIDLYLGFAAIRTFGQGSLTLIPTALVALWFIRLRGKATAIVSLGGALGQAVIPPTTLLLIAHLGWRNAWIALAFLVWGLLLIPVMIGIRRNPETVGLQPDGDKNPTDTSLIETREVHCGDTDWTLKEVIKTRSFWLLLFAASAQPLIGTGLVFHQVSIFAEKGLDATIATMTLTVMAVATMGGTLIAGFLTDRLPNRYVLALSQAMLILAMLWTFVLSVPWEGVVYGVILGIGTGLYITTNSVVFPNYFGRKHLGTIRGIATATMVACAAIGPMPFGVLFDFIGSYTIAIICFLALPAACALAAILAVPPNKDVKVFGDVSN